MIIRSKFNLLNILFYYMAAVLLPLGAIVFLCFHLGIDHLALLLRHPRFYFFLLLFVIAASRVQRITIADNRLTFSYPLLFGLAKSYDLADFDGMYTFDKNTEGRETPPLIFTVLTREGKIVASILTQNYANMDEIRRGLGSIVPDKGSLYPDNATTGFLFLGLKGSAPRIGK